jgi:hypothetical protein
MKGDARPSGEEQWSMTMERNQAINECRGLPSRFIVPAWAAGVLAVSAACSSRDVVGVVDAAIDSTVVVVMPDAPLIQDPLDGGATQEAGISGIPEVSCGASPYSASTKPVNMLLVIDRSGSMADPYGTGESKWAVLQLALAQALEGAKKSIAFGLELFPYSDEPKPPMCALPQGSASIQVPIGPGETTVPLVLAHLAKEPAGGTPTAAALGNAYDFFMTGDGRLLTGDKYVLLATDGGPNCNASHAACDATACTTNLDGECPGIDAGGPANCCDLPNNLGATLCVDDQETTNQLARLKAAGIRTFVVGLPGTDAYASYLDQFATAGDGKNPNAPPLYFNVDTATGVAGLAAVFTAITKELITTCRFQLASVPPDPKLLNVTIDGVIIPQLGPDGWMLDSSTTPPTVVIKGTTCSRVQTLGAESAQVVYGCPTFLIP